MKKPSDTNTPDFDYTDMARVSDRLLTPVVVIDPDSTIRYANGAAAQLVDAEPEQLAGRKALELIHPDDQERVLSELEGVVRGQPTGGFTRFRLRAPKRGSWRVIDSYAHNLIDDPDIRGILVSSGDVTEHENLSRALRALTKSNHVIMHATDEHSLMMTICESIIESGKYMLAWVGRAENDAQQSVRLVAASGVTEYLDDVHFGWGLNELGIGPTGEAIRSRTVQLVRDIPNSSQRLPWSDRTDEYHVKSACSFPLIVDSEITGALTIYSRDPEAFDREEIELLNEMADDLSFGITRLRHADRLARNEAYLREAERLAHVGHWEWDLSSQRLEFMAEEMFKIYGLTASQWQGDVDEFLSFVPKVEHDSVREAFERTYVEGSAEIVHRILRSDGEERIVHMRTETIVNGNGHAGRVVGITIDITEQMAARLELEHSRQFHLAIADNMAEGMIATNEEGIITFANAAAGRLVKLNTSEMIGSPTKSIFRFKRASEKSPSDVDCPLNEVWARGQSLKVDYDTIVRRDGKPVPVAYSASPLIVNGLRGAVIVFEEISERAAEQLRVERELEKLAWVGRIRDALDKERFVLYAQPIIDLATREVIQNELLIRMMSSDGELITPDEFLPTAEEYGLIGEIDQWVVGQAARLAARGHLVEFNLSAKSVADPRSLTTIRDAIEASGAPAENLVCEITETALVSDLETAGTFVRSLNDIGCQVALDDFGAGYGGFSYLKHLPVSYLKIDREFVRDISEETASQYVVTAVVNLAKAFGMRTVAEGVEGVEGLNLLSDLGVDHAQGYAIGRPVPIDTAFAQD